MHDLSLVMQEQDNNECSMSNAEQDTVRSIDCLVLEISLLPNFHACTPRQDRCRSKLKYCRGEGHDGWEVDRRVVTLLEHIIRVARREHLGFVGESER
eukprot:scaffold94905_cov36-Cyclotella_meneghiniana.AAC.13